MGLNTPPLLLETVGEKILAICCDCAQRRRCGKARVCAATEVFAPLGKDTEWVWGKSAVQHNQGALLGTEPPFSRGVLPPCVWGDHSLVVPPVVWGSVYTPRSHPLRCKKRACPPPWWVCLKKEEKLKTRGCPPQAV